MTARELLERVRLGYSELGDLKDEEMRLRISLEPRAQQITADRVQTSPPLDPMGDTEAKIAEIEEKYELKRQQIIDDRLEAEKYVIQLPHPEGTVLRRYYMSGRRRKVTYEEIGAELNYSASRIKQIKRQALTHMDALMKDCPILPGRMC